jgi:hypothetical protein
MAKWLIFLKADGRLLLPRVLLEKKYEAGYLIWQFIWMRNSDVMPYHDLSISSFTCAMSRNPPGLYSKGDCRLVRNRQTRIERCIREFQPSWTVPNAWWIELIWE